MEKRCNRLVIESQFVRKRFFGFWNLFRKISLRMWIPPRMRKFWQRAQLPVSKSFRAKNLPIIYGRVVKNKNKIARNFAICFELKCWAEINRRTWLVITWYWTAGLRQAPRRNEFPNRLYQRWLVVCCGWGSCRFMIGGSVADLTRCLWTAAWVWRSRKCAEWSSDFERFVSCGLIIIDGGEFSSWSVFRMAPLRGDFRSLIFGGLIEIREAGGDESNSEKRRNIFNFYDCLLKRDTRIFTRKPTKIRAVTEKSTTY